MIPALCCVEVLGKDTPLPSGAGAEAVAWAPVSDGESDIISSINIWNVFLKLLIFLQFSIFLIL